MYMMMNLMKMKKEMMTRRKRCMMVTLLRMVTITNYNYRISLIMMIIMTTMRTSFDVCSYSLLL